MLVGLHVEGWDHLILRAYLAKILGCLEADLEPDWIDGPGRGWQFVIGTIPKALRRFYHKCVQFVVVGIDNDGNVDLRNWKLHEDSAHPRHWLHVQQRETCERCRWCQVNAQVAATRPALNWLPKKSEAEWPVIVVVPVEVMEAWLLISLALLNPGSGSLDAEREPRRGLKQKFYGKPEPTRGDVEKVALPLIRALGIEQLEALKGHSKSFEQFAQQVDRWWGKILGSATAGSR